MEITLDMDRYMIMKYVLKQKGDFRFADFYHLLKETDPEKWNAEDVKITLEWLADMKLVKRKLVKAGTGGTYLYYQSCYDHEFLNSRIICKKDEHHMESVVYLCHGTKEKLRYRYTCIKEKLNYTVWNSPYKLLFAIAEVEFAIPMSPKEKELLREKIEGLE